MLGRYAAYQKYHYNNGKECIRGHVYGIRNAAMASGLSLNVRASAMPSLHSFYAGRLKEKPPKPKATFTSKQLALGFARIWPTNFTKMSTIRAYNNQVRRAVISAQFLTQGRSNRFTRPDINGHKIKDIEWDNGKHYPRNGKSKYMVIISDRSKKNHVKKLEYSITFCECKYSDGHICAVCENLAMYKWRQHDWKRNDPMWVVYKDKDKKLPVAYNDLRNWSKDLAKVLNIPPKQVATHIFRRSGDAHARKRGISDFTRSINAGWNSLKSAFHYSSQVSKDDFVIIFENELNNNKMTNLDLKLKESVVNYYINKQKRMERHSKKIITYNLFI